MNEFINSWSSAVFLHGRVLPLFDWCLYMLDKPHKQLVWTVPVRLLLLLSYSALIGTT